MTRYLRLLAIQLRISAASAMAYRANFWIQGVMTLAWLALTLLPLLVLYGRSFGNRSEVAGWDESSALIVIAYFTGVRAVLEGVVSPSLVDLVERIRNGSFDYVLLKPIDPQAMVSASHYEPWKVFDLVGAVGLVVYAFVRRGYAPSPSDVALGVALFFTGVAAMYALFVLCAAAAFWVVRLDNLMYLLSSVFDTARWPVHVLPGIWRVVFTFVIPIALMTTFPAMALLGTLAVRTALATAGGALAMLLISRFVWRGAIRSYTSASS
jgi:ABC-2 type transport system permease protein